MPTLSSSQTRVRLSRLRDGACAAPLLQARCTTRATERVCSLAARADPLINAHLTSVAAIGMEDISAWPQMTLNGGTWYFRARPDGPVQGLLQRFVRRALRVLRAYPHTRLYDEGKNKSIRLKVTRARPCEPVRRGRLYSLSRPASLTPVALAYARIRAWTTAEHA